MRQHNKKQQFGEHCAAMGLTEVSEEVQKLLDEFVVIVAMARKKERRRERPFI